jgi:ureidoglycolate lyase
MKLKVKHPSPENFTKFGIIVVPSFKESPATLSEYHNYWHKVADISQLGDEGTVGYLEIERKDRIFFLEKMERHQETLEAFIPMSGVGIFCLAPASPDRNVPDINSIEAFYIDGSSSFFLAPGVWHWLPFALTPQIKFTLLLKKSTVEKDLEIVDLPQKLDIVLTN